MRLRYILNDETEVAEITHMYRRGNAGYFVRTDGTELVLAGISDDTWRCLVSDMFQDGHLSLSMYTTRLSVRKAPPTEE